MCVRTRPHRVPADHVVPVLHNARSDDALHSVRHGVVHVGRENRRLCLRPGNP